MKFKKILRNVSTSKTKRLKIDHLPTLPKVGEVGCLLLPTQPISPTLPTTKKAVPEQALRSSRDFCSCLKEGGCLLSRIALQYHRRKRA